LDLNKSCENQLKKIEKTISSNKVKGKDLIKITDSKQLNLFLIKNIYDKWNQNFKKNKMNYFDYEAKEVEEATNNMMNVLSNNICVEFDEFKKLFYLSMTDIVELASNPKGFLKKDFLNFKWYDLERIKIRSKYYEYFKDLFNILIERVESNREISIKSHELNKYVDEITIEQNHELVKEVSVLLECNAEEISNIKYNNEFPFYSLFSINKNEVDSLIKEAKSKENFEKAAVLILDNLNEYYKKNLLSNDVKNLLFEIKKHHISPS
tara:strand:+ start:3482 stop:4279 length:798 start_codon:yes stop_codon:yes gene_type:complete